MSKLCIYEGMPLSPEMPGCCGRCSLYLHTCAPVIRGGFLTGAECDTDYCGFCPAYGYCAMYFTVEGDNGYDAVIY